MLGAYSLLDFIHKQGSDSFALSPRIEVDGVKMISLNVKHTGKRSLALDNEELAPRVFRVMPSRVLSPQTAGRR